MDSGLSACGPKSGLPDFGTKNVSKSATADFDEPRNDETGFSGTSLVGLRQGLARHKVTPCLVGERWVGARHGARCCHISRPQPPTPSPQGEGREFAAPSRRKL